MSAWGRWDRGKILPQGSPFARLARKRGVEPSRRRLPNRWAHRKPDPRFHSNPICFCRKMFVGCAAVKRPKTKSVPTTRFALLQGGIFIQNLSLIHISEPTRQAEISYAVFCLKKKNNRKRKK